MRRERRKDIELKDDRKRGEKLHCIQEEGSNIEIKPRSVTRKYGRGRERGEG